MAFAKPCACCPLGSYLLYLVGIDEFQSTCEVSEACDESDHKQ